MLDRRQGEGTCIEWSKVLQVSSRAWLDTEAQSSEKQWEAETGVAINTWGDTLGGGGRGQQRFL